VCQFWSVTLRCKITVKITNNTLITEVEVHCQKYQSLPQDAFLTHLQPQNLDAQHSALHDLLSPWSPIDHFPRCLPTKILYTVLVSYMHVKRSSKDARYRISKQILKEVSKEEGLLENRSIVGKTKCEKMTSNCIIPKTGMQWHDTGVTR
jgi:hypothetical protein